MSQLEALKFPRRPKTMALVQTQDLRQLLGAARGYWLTRFVILRLLGFIYAIAFLVAANQIVPLIGDTDCCRSDYFSIACATRSALPQRAFSGCRRSSGSIIPTPRSSSWRGSASRFRALSSAGYANAILLALLWILYMSIVHVGQDWYGYGWEVQLLETGFLAHLPVSAARSATISVARAAARHLLVVSASHFPNHARLRSYQNPRRRELARSDRALLSLRNAADSRTGSAAGFIFCRRGVLKFGTLFNHIAELVAPWFVFWPRIGRYIAGICHHRFPNRDHSGRQPFFFELAHDRSRARLFRRSRVIKSFAAHPRAPGRARRTRQRKFRDRWRESRSRWPRSSRCLSIQPLLNILSAHQIMNTSFDPFDLVNTYGAFGAVGKERYNVVFEGTDSYFPDETATWKPYPYKGLPVALDKRPPQIAPYQLRSRLADVVRRDGHA